MLQPNEYNDFVDLSGEQQFGIIETLARRAGVGGMDNLFLIIDDRSRLKIAAHCFLMQMPTHLLQEAVDNKSLVAARIPKCNGFNFNDGPYVHIIDHPDPTVNYGTPRQFMFCGEVMEKGGFVLQDARMNERGN